MNENVITNSVIQEMLKSSALAHNKTYLSSPVDFDFQIFEIAYQGMGKLYAELKSNIESGNCIDRTCRYEIQRLKQLEEYPEKSLDFMSTLLSELSNIDEPNFDLNNNYRYNIAYCILGMRPGFSKSDGYDVRLFLLEDGSQSMVFDGPALDEPLVINDIALKTLADINQTIISVTPDIEKNMTNLLVQAGIFAPDSIDENEELKPSAKISEEYLIVGQDGKPVYEVIEIGDGMGRNILKYDIDKITRKVNAFVEADIAGIMRFEQNAIAAWNVFFSNGDYWPYEENLPLSVDKRKIFSEAYKEYFKENYIYQFTSNQLPSIVEDAAVFSLEEQKINRAQQLIEANNL